MERKKSLTNRASSLGSFLVDLKINPDFKFLEKLKREFNQAEVYLVGGLVRDLFLKRKSKDYDFVVRRIDAKKLEKFLSRFGSVNLVGRQFGVFKFLPRGSTIGEAIDIALPRREHAEGTGGYRDFEVQSDPELPIEDDLARRDFTINALALNLDTGQVIDPFDGLKDLTAKLIRAVGQPEERFREDYSRMLRAIRFACQLGFEINKKTWAALKKLMPRINAQRQTAGKTERVIPYESIAKELAKSLVADPPKTLDLYDQSGALVELMPELLAMKGCPQPPEFHSEGDVFAHTRLALKLIGSTAFKKRFPDWAVSPELVFAVLYHDSGKPATIKTPEKDGTDRIRFNEHAEVGAALAGATAKRLVLANFGIKPERVDWLVANHMILVTGDFRIMRNSTIEKYFFDRETGELSQAGKNLLMLSFVDVSATIPARGPIKLENFKGIWQRIEDLKAITKERARLPKPLLNGDEIMVAFKLKPGPKIGQLLALLREEQLAGRLTSKKAGLKFLKDKI